MGDSLLVLDVEMSYVQSVGAISDTLQKFMEMKRLRVKDLMVKTGLSRPTVSRHVNGKIIPNVEDREKYASAFGVTLADFELAWQQEEEAQANKKSTGHPLPAPIEIETLNQVVEVFGIDRDRLIDTLGKINPAIAAMRATRTKGGRKGRRQ